MSAANIVAILAGGGIATAITKYVAEYRYKPIRLIRFLDAAKIYGGTFSVVNLPLSAIFAKSFSQVIISDTTLCWMMPAFGAAQ